MQSVLLFAACSVLFCSISSTELNIISKSEWGAETAKSEPTKLIGPVRIAIIIHTATNSCASRESCDQICRSFQATHFRRGYGDISYNFLIGADGLVYEGRGWDFVGAHTKGYNSQSIGIAFIGTFANATPTDGALAAAQKLLAEGVKLGKLDAGYKVHNHRQLRATESPGAKLVEIVNKWPHYSEVLN